MKLSFNEMAKKRKSQQDEVARSQKNFAWIKGVHTSENTFKITHSRDGLPFFA